MNTFNIGELSSMIDGMNVDDILKDAENKEKENVHSIDSISVDSPSNNKTEAEKIAELQGQLSSKTKKLKEDFKSRMDSIREEIANVTIQMKDYAGRGKDWCQANITVIKINIGKAIQKINDWIGIAVDWIKKQFVAVKDWIDSQIDTIRRNALEQANAIADFITDQAEKAAENRVRLEAKKLTVK